MLCGETFGQEFLSMLHSLVIGPSCIQGDPATCPLPRLLKERGDFSKRRVCQLTTSSSTLQRKRCVNPHWLDLNLHVERLSTVDGTLITEVYWTTTNWNLRGCRCGTWLCCLGSLRDRAARYCVEVRPLRYCSRCVDCGSQPVAVLRFAVEKVK